MIVGFKPCGCWSMAMADSAPSEDKAEMFAEALDAGLRLRGISDAAFKTAAYQCPVCTPKAFHEPYATGIYEPWYSRVQLEAAGQMVLEVAA